MCGIVGYFCGDRHVLDPTVLLGEMATALHHRGPDGSDIKVLDSCGLGHTRLSIVGLEDGQQPMEDASGRFVITFNGEIFNYVELREFLREKGIRFRTGSDTEVLLELFAYEGEAALDRLNGDFAFAIWDKRDRCLTLARDRAGVRPLFYMWRDGVFYFASEIKALLRVPGTEAKIDPIALEQIFTLWSPIAPRTPFVGIQELEPARVMTVSGSDAHTRAYWMLDFPDVGEESRDNPQTVTEGLEELFVDATRLRMRADVPVGSYLSGGLDSSMVAASAVTMSDEGLETYSVTFESAEHDESAFQKTMARDLGTRHHTVNCGQDEIASVFQDVIRATERPILRTAPAPLFRLSKLVRENGMKVVLTGEGADEVFAGYDIFKEARVRRFCARQPNSEIRPHLFRRLYPYLTNLSRQTPEYMAAYFGVSPETLADPLYSHHPRFKSTSATKLFFSSDLKSEVRDYDTLEELRDKLPERFHRWHPLNQAQYLETSFLLPGYILSSQGDRMAMANSVEGRFPFLDHRLIDFAAKLHPELKLKSLTEKNILREVARGKVPDTILDRPKQPYRAPESQSFAGKHRPEYVDRLMSDTALEQSNLFNPKSVSKLVRKCMDGAAHGFRDNAAFVGVLSTQIWIDEFTRSSATSTPDRSYQSSKGTEVCL
ncbi:asparagine synthase (glutamine-hydrolyzing) [Labrenzia sp. R4_2]|uniref:asparagine synthase (glutamine-hydrolyzing) n=1 Tax=Labrenzia sp. R4_2 TaxID=2821107 RepID=UPI001ADD4B6E|nr:asparagine synthase (glutamine-hydrolyzing) [Labrenzia sp. R4_2]MBO9422134.1 asparagine synthase (glutamine-hydrolyzing) [Labrenzia sp. R4_2]